MKFRDLPVAQFSVRVRSSDGSPLSNLFTHSETAASVTHVAASETDNTFNLIVNGAWASVTPMREADAVHLMRELAIGRAMLAELSATAADGSADLNIAFFTGALVEMGDVEIGVDEYVVERVDRIASRRVRDVYAWLKEQCVISHNGELYFCILAGAAIETVLAEPDDAAMNRANTEVGRGFAGRDSDADADETLLNSGDVAFGTASNARNSFCITGSDLRFVATTTQLPDGTAVYVAKKLTAHKQAPDKAVRLARGNLTFLDWTRTGRIQLQAKAQLAVLTSDSSSYLKKWDEFGELEGQILLSKAREVGGIEFTNPQPNRDGTINVRVVKATNTAIEQLRTNGLDELQAVASLPEYITNSSFTFSDFSAGLESDAPTDPSARFKVVSYDGQSQILTLKSEAVPRVGTFVLSLAGEVAQIKRRLQARRKILEGRSANPQLGLLVEEQGVITSLRPPQKIKPLTAFVREKVFKNPPTVMQERAIDVALNTPDIALIQGPPGTGKTTVVAAILERLNEIASKAGVGAQGQILLTGFQHDAVENMIDRISLNGIPVPKFGQRSNASEDDLSAFERLLDEWCKKVAQELRERNPQIAELEEEVAINDLYKHYLRTPTHKLASNLVDRIAEIDVAILGERLSRRVINLRERLKAQTAAGHNEGRLFTAAQRIRTRAESFKDDGPERAGDALVDLEEVLNDHQATLLERASSWEAQAPDPPFLDELKKLKRSLLVQLTSPPIFRIEKHSDEVLIVAEEAIRQVKRSGATAKDKKSAALAGFLAELENNPSGMADAVAEYSYAFAATVQQSVNKEMQRRKGVVGPESEEALEYEYVVVDEAARVSPRDLMIPMSQGKRIILVGDHRQLPHIINEEVAQQMEKGEAGIDEAEWLKRSMFQYLFSERLRALEATDGITRRVTLDKQFRMHPELGDFVSRNFYEAFEPTERFDSGLPASAFDHHLPGTNNKSAMWLSVPTNRGAARAEGSSWMRQPEIDEICRQLVEWIESSEGTGLTYGVISFYKAQADLIQREVRRHFGSIADDGKKIRVGTVDSFQGMEFDVVFLSIVRTARPNWTPRDRDLSSQARGLFGHLCLYNRLNVSMSRQKRLLVAVGDPALVTHELAPKYIPGLVDFYHFAQRLSAGQLRPELA